MGAAFLRRTARLLARAAGLALWLHAPLSFANSAVRIGALSGPGAQILRLVKESAAARGEGPAFEVVEFDDPGGLVRALGEGALEAAESPSQPFLEAAAPGGGLIAAAYTVTLPIAIYSQRLNALKELKPGDVVTIPSDRIGAARALILLHNCGLLGLRDGAGLSAGIDDITENPKELRIDARAPADLLASIKTVAAAVIPYDIAASGDLHPARDALVMEDGRSPFAGVLAVRAPDRDAPFVKALIAAYHSDAIKSFILTQFADSVRRPW